jgi:hypothetical protein
MSQVPQIESRLAALLRATSGNFLEQFEPIKAVTCHPT